MKRFLILTSFLGAISGFGQTPAPAPSEAEEQGTTLPDYISQIAEKDEISAEEFANMASGTMQVAMQVMQQGEQMPEPPLRDALDAVLAGRAIDPEAADWDKVEQQLLDLLNPPHQDQEQQEGENSEDQEGEQDGEQQEQDGQSGSSEESGENSEQSEGQSQEDGSEQEQGGQQGEEGEQQQEGQEGDPESQDGQEQQPGEEGEQEQMPNTQDGAQMGELDQNQEDQQVELDGEPQPPQQAQPEQMQTVGGQQTTGEPIDAEMAALKQLLEQLKQQDEPGKLYQILQEAQSGGKKKQQPNAKDW